MRRLANRSTADCLGDKVKEQRKTWVTDCTIPPRSASGVMGDSVTTHWQTLYAHRKSDGCRHRDLHNKSTNALWVLQAVAILSTFCQKSLMHNHWHYHVRVRQPVRQSGKQPAGPTVSCHSTQKNRFITRRDWPDSDLILTWFLINDPQYIVWLRLVKAVDDNVWFLWQVGTAKKNE